MHTVFGRYALESFLEKAHLLGVQASLPASFPRVRYSAICCHVVRSSVTNDALGVIPPCLLRSLAGRFTTCLERGASTEDLEEDLYHPGPEGRDQAKQMWPIGLMLLLYESLGTTTTRRLSFWALTAQSLDRFQFGFGSERSSSDALLDLAESDETAISERRTSRCCFLDGREEFDSVPTR